MTGQTGKGPGPPDPATSGAGRPAGGDQPRRAPSSGRDQPEPRLVVRDKRKLRAAPGGTGPATGTPAGAPAPAAPEEPAGPEATATPAAGEPSGEATAARPGGAGGLGAELESLRAELDERTRDLQRVTAEYANYRKRVERDRALAGEQAIANVLGALLPVLDDLDRAREHGELVDGFGAVAEQIVAATSKLGLNPFGEKGDRFDPTRHEAVAHLTSAEVTEPTCIDVLRRGYLLGDRLLRPAMVAVADPE